MITDYADANAWFCIPRGAAGSSDETRRRLIADRTSQPIGMAASARVCDKLGLINNQPMLLYFQTALKTASIRRTIVCANQINTYYDKYFYVPLAFTTPSQKSILYIVL